MNLLNLNICYVNGTQCCKALKPNTLHFFLESFFLLLVSFICKLFRMSHNFVYNVDIENKSDNDCCEVLLHQNYLIFADGFCSLSNLKIIHLFFLIVLQKNFKPVRIKCDQKLMDNFVIMCH